MSIFVLRFSLFALGFVLGFFIGSVPDVDEIND